MSTYKEIQLNLETIPISNESQAINDRALPQNSNQLNQKAVRARGLTYSLLNQIIYVTVEDNILQVVTISTQLDNSSQNNSKEEIVAKYQFTLPSLILDSITITEVNKSANSYLITIFTDNGHIQSFFKKLHSDFTVLRGSYQDDLNIVSVEYIYSIQSDLFFSFGSSSGKVFIMSLTETNGRLVLSHRQTISLSSTNMLLRVFQQEPVDNGINSMKYIGNNLLCFVDTKFLFSVYNINSKSVILSNNLVTKAKDDLLSSRIIFNPVDLSKQEIELYRTKIFNVLIYLEYFDTYEVISFELWFKKIPESSLNQTHPRISSEELFNIIELGNDISLRNKRVYILRGQLVDMNIQDNKLWIIVENKRKVMNHLLEGKFDDKYSIGIISLKQYDNDNNNNVGKDDYEIHWNSDNIIDYQEKSMKNIINILEQINSNKCLALREKNEICLSLISNEEFFQKETLIKVFNQSFKQNFTNKAEVLNMLKQQSNSLSLDVELIIPLIQEELKSNEIVSTGCFNNTDLLSLCLIRKKGIGLIRTVGFFERIDQEISQHEYNIRNILFNHNSTNVIHIKKNVEETIEEYALIECKYNQSNALYLIFALIRIYLTEINLLITNEDYLLNIFYQNPNMAISSFIEKVFDENLSIQSNNLGFLDFVHLIIKDLVNNNMEIIIEEVNDIINEYTKIKDMAVESLAQIPASGDNNGNFGRCNDKYCDIISKMASNKISSLFHVSRDILTFSSWQRVYSEFEDIDENISGKMNQEAIRLLFTETFSSYLFSNHITAISSSNNSMISSLSSNKEMTLLEQIVYDNISQYKISFLKHKDNKYIDLVISSLMPDLIIQDTSKYALYQKAYSNKDFNLITLINRIQNDINSIQLVFLEVLWQAKLITQSNRKRMDLSLNDYYSKLLEMSAMSNGKTSFKKFADFYTMMISDHYISNQSGMNYHMKSNDTGSSILIQGFQFIEKELLNILTKEEMNSFYLLSFNWIFRNVKSDSHLNHSSVNNHYEETNISSSNIIYEGFIINFFKSAITIDIRYALSSYNTIKQIKHSSSLIIQITEFFANYVINTFQFNSKNEFVSMLIANDYDLLCKICQLLESKCNANLDNTQLISLLNMNRKMTSITKQSSLNFFELLFNIYSQMKDYQLACVISYKYSKVLDNAIITDNFSMEMMMSLYQEKITSLNNAIIMLKKCKESNQDFLYESITPSILKPVSLESLVKEKKFSEVKVVLLKKYGSTKELKEAINEEMISKIKNDNCLLNLIFQMRMYDIIIGMNMISFVNETQGKIMIYNLISNFLQSSSGDECEGIKSGINYEVIKVFIDQVKGSKCDEFAYHALEALLYFDNDYQVDELIAYLQVNNTIRLMQILLKYSKFTHLINIMNFNYKQGEEIPMYIREHIKVLQEKNHNANEQLALKKCKEIINQLAKNQ